MRRSERAKKSKRPFSPSELAGSSLAKKPKGDGRLKSKSETRTSRGFDLDPYGEKFECWKCGSNYIIDPAKKKKSQKKRLPKLSPRYSKNVDQDKVMLCNACGLREQRPKKRHHNSSSNNSSQRNEWVDAEREKYVAECQHFTSMLCKQLTDTDAERLYCPYFNTRQCGCVQSYVIGQDGACSSEDQQSRARKLIELVRTSRQLATLRHWEEGKDDSANRQSPCKSTKRGLGNGQKKSLVYQDYILDKRAYLREQLNFCEKGCQKILGYSNNLLYRKLKTVDNQPRVKVTRGYRDKLSPLDDLVKETCCTHLCTALVKSYPVVLQEWRSRAAVNKTECRRVIAEMATPYSESFQNCNKFIRLVTGSSLVTIGKVRRQIISTGGERVPPEHGLKRYWKQKQQAQQNVFTSLREQEGGVLEKVNRKESESETTREDIMIKLTEKREETRPTSSDNNGSDKIENKEESVAEKKGTKPDLQQLVLPNLLVKRALLIQEQKALVQKQGMLRSKQDLVERELIHILQHQGEVKKRTRKRSGQGVNVGGTGSSLCGFGVNGKGQSEVSRSEDVCSTVILSPLRHLSKDYVLKPQEKYSSDRPAETRSCVPLFDAEGSSEGDSVKNMGLSYSVTDKGNIKMSEPMFGSQINNKVKLMDTDGIQKTIEISGIKDNRWLTGLNPNIVTTSLGREDSNMLANHKNGSRDITSKLSEFKKTNEFEPLFQETASHTRQRMLSMGEALSNVQNSSSLNSKYVAESSCDKKNPTSDELGTVQVLNLPRPHGLLSGVETHMAKSAVQYMPQYSAYTDPCSSTQEARPNNIILRNNRVVPVVSGSSGSPCIQPVTVLGSVNTVPNSGLPSANQRVMLQIVKVDTPISSVVHLPSTVQGVSVTALTHIRTESSTIPTSTEIPSITYSDKEKITATSVSSIKATSQVRKPLRVWCLCLIAGILLLLGLMTYRKPVTRTQPSSLSGDKSVKREIQQHVASHQYAVYDPKDIQVPLPLLKDFRNPCFLQDLASKDPYSGVVHDHRLKQQQLEWVQQIYANRIKTNQSFRVRCLPSFFIAGVQKCGTTDLQHMVSLHRQMANFTIKENHWWNRGRFQSAKTDLPITMEGYLDLFDLSAEQIYSHVETAERGQDFHPMMLGDTSPALLWDQGFWRSMSENVNKPEPVETVAHVINRVLPQAKFVIILRNPTERLYSDWHMFGNPQFLKGLTSSRFHEKIVDAVNSFDECTLTEPMRTCFYDALHNDPREANKLREKHPWWNSVFRLRMGLYYIFIKDLLDVFPRDQVFIFRLEDYSKDRLKWLQEIYIFLGLDPDPDLADKVKYETVHNKARKTHKAMLPETRELLDDFYGDYNKKLAELLQDKGYLWKTTGNITF